MSVVSRTADGKKLLLGVVHLLPLPGSPRFTSRAAVAERALADAEALMEGGLDGFVVENYGDAPFYPDAVPPATIAEMSALGERIRNEIGDDALIGINVLRNDGAAALSIAAAIGATFVRINVHTGVAYADQGVLEGRAHETTRLRRVLQAPIEILADVAVKHASMPPGFSLTQAARDTALRGLADGLIVTGAATGAAAARADLQAVRAAVPGVPLLVGSGVTDSSVAELLAVADGVIVGTFVKHEGDVSRPVALDRVRRLAVAARGGSGERLG